MNPYRLNYKQVNKESYEIINQNDRHAAALSNGLQNQPLQHP